MDSNSVMNTNNDNVQNVETRGITLFYSKRTGEIISYSACSTPQSFEDYWGSQAEDMRIIYDSIFTDFDIDIIHNPKDFIIDINTKTLKKKVDPIRELRSGQLEQDNLIDVNLLANTELYEMMLNMTPARNNLNLGGSNMVEVYVALIIKGKKTLEQVPLIIRKDVEQTLKDLGVVSQ